MKKLIVPLFILLVCASLVVGCGSSTSSSTPTATATTTQTATAKPNATTAVTTAPTVTSTSTIKPTVTTSPTPTTQASAKYGGTVRIIDPTSPGTPIGAPWETSGGSVLCMQLALQFPIKEELGGKYIPNLAASYDVVTDAANPSITLHLQKGVKFHDGTDFNAQAVKWNFDKVKVGNLYASVTTNWKSLEVLDDYTLRINLISWFNRAVRSFADSVTMIVSPAAFDKNGIDWIRWHMVGTGPFMQQDFQKDVSLTTVRNPNYWEKDLPYLDKVQYLFVADEMTRVALFKSGGGEILNTNGSGRVAMDMQNAGFNIVTQAGGATVMVPDSANADSPWSNLKVRQAADCAIDKEAIAKTLGYGFWTAAYQINSPASLAYDKSLNDRKYDVAKAKQLLTDAGYPNGFKTRLLVANTADTNISAAVQSYLSKVGIQADIEVDESAKFQAYQSGTWKNALLITTLIEWANPTVAFNFFFGSPTSWFLSLNKPVGWKDAVAAASTSPALDPTLVTKVEDMAYNDAMIVPLYYGASMWAVAPNVKDSGLGTRGASTWWEPQLTYLSK